MRPKTLDHVALWVADRDAITDFLTERLSMHVIERTERFTLVGPMLGAASSRSSQRKGRGNRARSSTSRCASTTWVRH